MLDKIHVIMANWLDSTSGVARLMPPGPTIEIPPLSTPQISLQEFKMEDYYGRP